MGAGRLHKLGHNDSWIRYRAGIKAAILDNK